MSRRNGRLLGDTPVVAADGCQLRNLIAAGGANDVAVIDVEKLALASRISAGTEPQGLIVR